jgi:AraC family transcriptional regulator, regulatory protein of adaptative response / methylated-DNA-[protein]-cysteine methyltransferase
MRTRPIEENDAMDSTPTSAPATPARPRAAARFASDSQRWAAIVRREPGADGIFYYAVRTTGVFCRPSCGARRALRKNVRFFDSAAAAEQAGFRACKRCHPRGVGLAQQQAAMVARACRLIDQAESMPDLATLAADAGISRFHFHRLFTRVTGVTPKAYVTAQRARRVREGLLQQGSVTGAIYDAGFGSNGRFYAGSAAALGMTPSTYRAGGDGVRIRFAIGACSLGSILVATTDKGICAILLGDDAAALLRELEDRFPKAQLLGGDQQFERLLARVAGLVEAPARGLDLPLDLRGTAFQHRVWQALRRVRPGTTVSYSELARRLGRPGAARAVGGAVAANPLAIAIPCHRVIRRDGTLSGYRWGVARKRALLEREARMR